MNSNCGEKQLIFLFLHQETLSVFFCSDLLVGRIQTAACGRCPPSSAAVGCSGVSAGALKQEVAFNTSAALRWLWFYCSVPRTVIYWCLLMLTYHTERVCVCSNQAEGSHQIWLWFVAFYHFLLTFSFRPQKRDSSGSRTRLNCVEGKCEKMWPVLSFFLHWFQEKSVVWMYWSVKTFHSYYGMFDLKNSALTF